MPLQVECGYKFPYFQLRESIGKYILISTKTLKYVVIFVGYYFDVFLNEKKRSITIQHIQKKTKD